MSPQKKEAIEFCLNKYLLNKMVDIWLTVILTLGLALIIFPIFGYLIYKYYKAKKEVRLLKEELSNNPDSFDSVYASIGYGYTRLGDKVANSVDIYMNGMVMDVPQLYVWFSKYKSKEKLAEVLNE
jgi:hypothetical protein